MSTVHALRRRVRDALKDGTPLRGTFLKLAALDVVELAAAAGFDFVVVDLEHSTLSEAEALAMVRHAHLCGLPALVRIPRVDAALVARLLENGAAGLQLSTLSGTVETADLVRATRCAPHGSRSVSLANRVAGFGAVALSDFLAAEVLDPPLLVGQIETLVAEPLTDVVAGLDVAFVGTTDLAVCLELPAPHVVAAAVREVEQAAVTAGVTFGGWAASLDELDRLGLADAGYVVVGSDVQLLARALRAAATPPDPAEHADPSGETDE